MDITNNEQNKKLTGGRVKSLIMNKANDVTNKLESFPFNLTDQTMIESLENSDFKRLRRKMGKLLSVKGKAAMYAIPHKGMYITDVMEVTNYSTIGKLEVCVEGTNGSVVVRNGVTYPVHSSLKYIDNKPTISTYVEYLDAEGMTMREDLSEPYVYPGDRLPVEVFLNNEEGISDIEYAGVVEDLQRLNYFDGKQQSEWERTRTLPAYNTNYTDNDPRTDSRDIDNGRGYMVEDSYNAKMGAGTQLIPATNGTAVLQNQILFLENDIYKKLGIKRDSTDTGTNKHNLEMVMSEQYALETLLYQKEIREEHYNQYFAKLAVILGVDKPEPVELVISPIEQAKLDLLASTVLEAQMKAQNIASQPTSEEENED